MLGGVLSRPSHGFGAQVLEQLEAKVERLAARKRELKAQLLSAQRKEQVFVQRMDAHMDEVTESAGAHSYYSD